MTFFFLLGDSFLYFFFPLGGEGRGRGGSLSLSLLPSFSSLTGTIPKTGLPFPFPFSLVSRRPTKGLCETMASQPVAVLLCLFVCFFSIGVTRQCVSYWIAI